MAEQKWVYEFGEQSHTVEIKTEDSNGQHVVTFDGEEIEQMGDDPPHTAEQTLIQFDAGDHLVYIKANSEASSWSYSLSVDYKSTSPKSKKFSVSKPPGWVWGFVAACVLIPIISLGGFVPIGLAASGSLLCYNFSKRAGYDTASRIVGCLMITLLVWGTFIAIGVITALSET